MDGKGSDLKRLRKEMLERKKPEFIWLGIVLVSMAEDLMARIVVASEDSPAHRICLNASDNLSSVGVGFAMT
ncbi:hypothetical protein TNCV_2189151 [Trichonephila clavipes]|nr:hypothetical protein TNCV_2189151 [Trichonephila clavipes]